MGMFRPKPKDTAGRVSHSGVETVQPPVEPEQGKHVDPEKANAVVQDFGPAEIAAQSLNEAADILEANGSHTVHTDWLRSRAASILKRAEKASDAD